MESQTVLLQMQLFKDVQNHSQRHEILQLNQLTLQVKRYFVSMEFAQCCDWGSLLKQVIHSGSLAHRCSATGSVTHQTIHGSRLLLLQLNLLFLDMDKNLKKSKNWAAKAPMLQLRSTMPVLRLSLQQIMSICVQRLNSIFPGST